MIEMADVGVPSPGGPCQRGDRRTEEVPLSVQERRAVPAGPTVDVHAHVLLPAVERLVDGHPGLLASRQREGASLGATAAEENARRMQGWSRRLVDVEARVEHMDATGIDVQLVSVAPSQYHSWAGPALATEVYEAVDEGVAAHCAQRPERLTGLGVAPLQHPELAVPALEHAVLGCGLRGVEVSTSGAAAAGDRPVELSDPRLEPFWERAEQLGALVFVHPFGTTLGTRLDRWYLANTVGQPLEDAVAMAHLIHGGVLDRHPALRVLVAHGGGYLPPYLGRGDHAWRERPDARSCARPPSSYLGQVMVDSAVLGARELAHLVSVVGARGVLLGTDYPFDMSDETPLRTLADAGLDEAETRLVAGGNAQRAGLVPVPSAPAPGRQDARDVVRAS